jgi:hypothetical protein
MSPQYPPKRQHMTQPDARRINNIALLKAIIGCRFESYRAPQSIAGPALAITDSLPLGISLKFKTLATRSTARPLRVGDIHWLHNVLNGK